MDQGAIEDLLGRLVACGMLAFYFLVVLFIVRLVVQAVLGLCRCSVLCFNKRDKICLLDYCNEHCWMYCHGECKRSRLRSIK
jgi:hypothetical protein